MPAKPEPGPKLDVDARPSKRFFVDMLTRDIDLDEALLDLLDNCHDGVLRSIGDTQSGDEERPYLGFRAEITIEKDRFVIKDNCGGISRKTAVESAFRMGRPSEGTDPGLPTIGMYGIGMKRAIFKMGYACSVHSCTADEEFEITIDKNWMTDEKADDPNSWKLPIRDFDKNPDSTPGLRIDITDLRPPVAAEFGDLTERFIDEFKRKVAEYYGFIILKGFEVVVNGKQVRARTGMLYFDERMKDESFENEGIAPYVYEASIDGVDITIAVGFYRKIRGRDEVYDDLDETEAGKNEDLTSGWTVVCNDRIVLFGDKTHKTGWGYSGTPRYHNQFATISGLAIFKSNDPTRLPLTTTKQGLEDGSDIYRHALSYMAKGTKIFTSYTNKWKQDADSEHKQETYSHTIETAGSYISSILENRLKPAWGDKAKGREFDPPLPLPKKTTKKRVIRFTRLDEEVRKASQILFDTPDAEPGEVGAECFDEVIRRAN